MLLRDGMLVDTWIALLKTWFYLQQKNKKKYSRQQSGEKLDIYNLLLPRWWW